MWNHKLNFVLISSMLFLSLLLAVLWLANALFAAETDAQTIAPAAQIDTRDTSGVTPAEAVPSATADG